MNKRLRLPARLARARLRASLLYAKFVNRYMKSVQTAGLQRGFDETFCKMAESHTWEALCQQVFDQYVGQLSFTPVTQIHLLAEKLHVTSQSHVLELAPGTGGLSLFLAKLTGCRLTGQDASPLAVQIANRRATSQGLAERVYFKVGVLPELRYQENYFDAVVSIDSVYSVTDKAALFRGCYRALQPSGRLGFYALYKRRELSIESQMHARAFFWLPLQPYSHLLKDAGFKDIVRIDLTENLIQLAKKWVKAVKNNKVTLYKELGANETEGLLADFRTAWVLANRGYIGRALFIAQKP